VYQIKVTDPQQQSWCIQKRYREIRELHDQMKLRYPELLTWFPPKKFFGNTDRKFIDEREKSLQCYLQQVLAIEPLCHTRVLQDFLLVPTKTGVQPVESTESFVQQLLASAKQNFIDLSQPSDQILDPLEQEARHAKYNEILLQIPPLMSKKTDRSLCCVQQLALPQFASYTLEKWEQVVFSPSNVASEETLSLRNVLSAMCSLLDPKRSITGVDKLREEFKQFHTPE